MFIKRFTIDNICIEIQYEEQYSDFIQHFFTNQNENKSQLRKYIISLTYCGMYNVHMDGKTFSYNDLNSMIWKVISLIKELVINETDKVILHGAAVIDRVNPIVLLGKRYSGKSTMTYDLLRLYPEFKYIDDDLLIYSNSKIMGTGLPVKLRHSVENSHLFFDDYMIEGYYYSPAKKYHEFVPFDTIILPRYQNQGSEKDDNTICELRGNDKFSAILNNVRVYQSSSKCFKMVHTISQECRVYAMHYTSTAMAINMLQEKGLL